MALDLSSWPAGGEASPQAVLAWLDAAVERLAAEITRGRGAG